ncbi:hypothetical protein D3C76_1369480 [compost metagenome]
MMEGDTGKYQILLQVYTGYPRVKTANCFITKENIVKIFQEHQIPTQLDLLSIDIDGNDYWIWQALADYKPRAVIIEYNASYPPPQKRVTPYDAGFVWDGTSYFGASLASLEALGYSMGYALVGTDSRGVNAFFIRQDLLAKSGFAALTAEEAYHPPGYGYMGKGHPWRDGPHLEI